MEPLDSVFLNAREIDDPVQRAAYLAQACGADAKLRARVDAMLRDAEAAEQYFAARENDPARRGAAPPSEGPGALIGRYKLLQKIGEGGMGVVYMAEQREPVVRKVALKIIKLGMDTGQVVARFEAERQALALMDHPNIAKVLDGGQTENGRPYFVMDLVQGLPITQFCDEAKLGTRERLELFLDVCSAIQHAHQKGIIHRDIKPSNILVTLHGDKPVPKVIDFGVAKATQQPLTDKTLFTQFQHFLGTPAYMSPEQASLSGLDMDTRSDIYALGVLLYELLTGQTPFDGKELLKSGLDEMRRTIREKEPPRPSTRLKTLGGDDLTTTAKLRGIDAPKLIHLLRGDLDWIVIKCLEKDRVRRYATANGLAADVQRHLSNEPVLVRPPSKLYRLEKAYQRNKLGFGAGAAILATLLMGLSVASWGLMRERNARADAEMRRREADNARIGEKAQRGAAEANALRARRNLYAADMLLAQQALAENNWGQVQQLLKTHLPAAGEIDLRGWEWRYLWEQSRSEALFELTSHDQAVLALARSSDGRLLASLSGDQTVRVFDLGQRREIGRFHATDRHPLSELRHYSTCFEFSPQSDLIGISERDRGVTLLSLPSLRTIHENPLAVSNRVRSFSFNPKGAELVLLNDSGRVGYAVQTGERLWSRPDLSRPNSSLMEARISPEGRYYLQVDWNPRNDKWVRVWDSTKGKEIAAWEQFSWIGSAAFFSPDSRYVAVGGHDATNRKALVVVFNLEEEREQWRASMPPTWVCGLGFSPDSKTLATGSTDHLVRLWRTDDGKELATLRGHRNEPWALTFSADGQTLFVGDKQGGVTAWPTRPRARVDSRQPVPPDVTAWLSSRDGLTRILVRTTGIAEFSSESTGARSFFALSGTDIRGIDLSFDGSSLAVARRNGRVELWNPTKGLQVKALESAESTVKQLCFSDDGRRLAGIAQAASDSRGSPPGGTVSLWDAQTGRIVFRPTTRRRITALEIDQTGRRLAIGSDVGYVEVWDAESRHRLLDVRAHGAAIMGLAFSPEGTNLASAAIDARLRILDLATGKILADPFADRNSMESVTYSPDGRRLVATGSNGDVYLFETEGFHRVAQLKLPITNNSKGWLTRDGKMILDCNIGFYVFTAPMQTDIDNWQRW